MKDKLLKLNNYLLETIVLLIFALIPVYFAFIYNDFSTFSLDKAIAFQILTEIALFLFIIKTIIEKKIRIANKQFLFLLILYFLILFLKTVWSDNFENSFWGSYWRQQGLFMQLHYFTFVVILSAFIDSRDKIKRIILSILAGGSVVCIYGIFQWFGIDFFDLYEKVTIFGRVVSSIGQPVMLANYILLVTPVSLFFFFIKKQAIPRFFYLLLSLLSIFTLMITYSRGAWIGLIVSFLAFGVLCIYISGDPKKNIFKLSGVFLFFTAILVLYTIFLPNNFFTKRIKSYTDLNSASASLRREYWLAALDAFSQKPILGYGLENQHDIFTKYYNKDWSIMEDIGISPDRSHNEYLDLLLNGGCVLLLSFFTIVYYVCRMSLQKLKHSAQEDKYLTIFLVSGLAGYLCSLFFSFSSTETAVLFWFYIIALTLISNDLKAKEYHFRGRILYIPLALLTVYFIFLPILIVNYNIDYVVADNNFRKARISLAKMDYPNVFGYYSKVFQYNYRSSFYQWFFINDVIGTMGPDTDQYKKDVLKIFSDIIEQDPAENDFSKLLRDAKVYSLKSKYEDKKYLPQAERTYDKLIAYSPNMPDPYRGRAQLYILNEDYEKALGEYKILINILPSTDMPRQYVEHRQALIEYLVPVYKDIAYCYYKLANYDKAIETYKVILDLKPEEYVINKFLADVYKLKNENRNAIFYYTKMASFEQNNYIWPGEISKLYFTSKEGKNALIWANRSLMLAPQNKKLEIENFIKKLQTNNVQ